MPLRKTIFLVSIACAAVVLFPNLTSAQDSAGGAADEAKFRVIKRFDVTEPAALTIAPVEWPFGADTRAAVERRDWKTAWAGMSGMEPKKLSPEFAFLAGYVGVQTDEGEAARPFLIRARDSEHLAPLAHLYAARAAEAEKEWEIAAAEAARVRRGSLYHDDAAYILARALLESGRADDALRAARSFAASDNADGLLIYADALRARGDEGDLVKAARLYHKVAQRNPNTGSETTARTSLEAIVGSLPTPVQKEVELGTYTQDAALARYGHLFDRHRSKTVTKELPRLAAKWKVGSDERCEALYLIAKSYTKLREHGTSLPWYAKLSQECSGKDRRRGLYLGGKAAWNAGEKATALAIYNKLVQEFPDHSFADDALYFSARILREENKVVEARKTLERQVDTYPKGDMAKDAHWLIVREHFAKGELEEVVSYVDGLDSTGEHDLYSKGRLAYFRARALQQLGRTKPAREAFREVVQAFPASYYALLAFNRVAEIDEAGARGSTGNLCSGTELCKNLNALGGKPIAIPEKLRADDRFSAGLALVRIGLDELARTPFTALSRTLGDDDETRWALAYLLDQAGAYPLSHNIVRREIEGWIDGYPLPNNPAATRRWSIAFPRPFDRIVTQWANSRGIAAELIWAIMREESGFSPGVESWANARGLMQLMPGTARVVAREDGMGGVSNARLFEPEVAVRLGSAYLADLGSKVDHHPAVVIAGYNGGWGNVSRWLEKADSRDLDLWVEDIPYGQTRKYTKRVLATYWAYHWDDSGAVVPRVPLSL